MERPGFASDAKLPGFDTLHYALNESVAVPIDADSLATFVFEGATHRTYLENEAFHRYLRMHKVMPGISGAKELHELGRALESASLPVHIDAAAWAYAESGLVDTSLASLERIRRVARAEELWQTALHTELTLEASEYRDVFNEPSAAYRYALPLAFTPLMKSVIVGNVTKSIRKQALADTVAFASAASQEVCRYEEAGLTHERSMFNGLLHELNALTTLLYIDDPRYVPMPSTARADTGYYHPAQTHDIMIINHHWGVMKKVIPIEIKAKASARDRRRYQSLLIRGKMHLATDGTDPRETAALFERILGGGATAHDEASAERITTDVRELLRLYQQGITPENLAVRSLTRFQQSASLAKAHPEIAP